MVEKSERRKYPRIPVKLFTYIKRLDEQALDLPMKVTATDLSEGGLFIELAAPFGVGAFVELELDLPNESGVGSSIVALRGIIRWSRETPPVGIGIEIIDASEEERARLQAYLGPQGHEAVGA